MLVLLQEELHLLLAFQAQLSPVLKKCLQPRLKTCLSELYHENTQLHFYIFLYLGMSPYLNYYVDNLNGNYYEVCVLDRSGISHRLDLPYRIYCLRSHLLYPCRFAPFSYYKDYTPRPYSSPH